MITAELSKTGLEIRGYRSTHVRHCVYVVKMRPPAELDVFRIPHCRMKHLMNEVITKVYKTQLVTLGGLTFLSFLSLSHSS